MEQIYQIPNISKHPCSRIEEVVKQSFSLTCAKLLALEGGFELIAALPKSAEVVLRLPVLHENIRRSRNYPLCSSNIFLWLIYNNLDASLKNKLQIIEPIAKKEQLTP